MATAQIYWGDGTSDKITVTFSGNVGSSQMTVACDPNNFLTARIKNIVLKSTGGATLGMLTVSQQPRSRAYSIGYDEAYK
ncbi:MAG: hypothetical protein LBD52_07510 [Prevotellaceae bacterium]|jgi:hypothetical protein|nr:hypothetical protein [Prevotellaceae bacterium]